MVGPEISRSVLLFMAVVRAQRFGSIRDDRMRVTSLISLKSFRMTTNRTCSQPTAEDSPAVEHRASGSKSVQCAVVTVSDSRTLETDTSGALIVELLQQAGFEVATRVIVPDGPERLSPLLQQLRDRGEIQAILLTGGTGLAPRDLTPEVVREHIDVELPGFGELFRMLSWEQVGAAAMLSRAFAGRMGRSIVFLMPGSRNAVRLAMEKLILPELSHLVGHL